MRLKVFSIISAIIVIIELVLCFTGPLALVQKPSLIVFPLYYYNLSEYEVEKITQYVEMSIAQTKSFSIAGRNLFNEYLHKKRIIIEKREDFTYKNAATAAAEMNLDRFVIISAGAGPSAYELTVIIRETKSMLVLKKIKVKSNSIGDLLHGIQTNGQTFRLNDLVNIETKGISIYDWIFFLLLAGQFILAVFAFMNKEPGNFPELIIVITLILFLLAYIYALNANMDYVQRFILTKGQLALAESTVEEQIYAFIRFFPLLLLNLWYYFWRRLGKSSKDKIYFTFNISHPVKTIRHIMTPWALLWSIISGVLFALSHPSFVSIDGIFILGWISLVPLFLVFIYEKYWWAVFHGATFGAIQALIMNYWHGTFNYITLYLVIIASIIQYIIFMIPLIWVIKKSCKWGFLFAPVIWVVFDFLRGNGIIGYPWGMPGTSQFQLIPFIQIAALTGVWGITFIIVFFNSAAAWIIAGPGKKWHWGDIPGTKKIFPILISSILIFINTTGGLLYMHLSGFWKEDKTTVNLVLVQQNTDPRKHDYSESLSNLVQLTSKAIEELGSTPDLIVWSECAFHPDTRYYSKIKSDFGNAKLVAVMLEFQKQTNTWLITGNMDHASEKDFHKDDDNENKIYYNSAVLFDPEGNRRETYHKIHLVPFTEYFPWKKQLPEVYKLLKKFDISDWTPGKERVIFNHDKFRFISPICFEDVFSNDIRLFIKNDVDIIVNLSNDYWSLTPVEGKQHGIIALFRAVENRRPLVRATASGYTVHINSYGQIQPGDVPFYTKGYTIARVSLPDKKKTVYTELGDWFPVICLLLLLTVIIYYSIKGIILKRR